VVATGAAAATAAAAAAAAAAAGRDGDGAGSGRWDRGLGAVALRVNWDQPVRTWGAVEGRTQRSCAEQQRFCLRDPCNDEQRGKKRSRGGG